MNEENNTFENSPTELIDSVPVGETKVVSPVTPPPEAVGWVSEPEAPEEEKKSKKGAVIAIAIVAVIAAGIGIAAAAGAFSPAPANTDSSGNVALNVSDNKAANANAVPENQSADEKDEDEVAESGDKPESSDPGSAPSGSSASQGASFQGGSGSSTQRVWVVDRAAYDEVVHHSAQGYQTPVEYYTMCTACGAKITGSPSAHGKSAHPGQVISWTEAVRGGEWVETSPAYDEVIHHDEVGHWEYR